MRGFSLPETFLIAQLFIPKAYSVIALEPAPNLKNTLRQGQWKCLEIYY